MKRKLLITLIILVVLAGAAWGTLAILKKKNQYVYYYYNLPKEVRQKSVELEWERLIHKIAKPKPDPEKLEHIHSGSLEKSIRLGADWILKMQEHSGRYNYWYNPETNEYSEFWDDNFLRQAGTSYSLTVVYEVVRDSQYLQAASKNLAYLMRFKKELDQDKEYYLFNGKAKLGGIALPMLAMLKIRELTNTTEYDQHLIKLANMIFYLQEQYGTGQFKSTYVYRGDYEHEKTTGWESKIYPGEAMLALAEMYKAFGDKAYKESFDQAAKFYDSKKFWGKRSFMPWTISALASMAVQTGDEYYADYARKIIRKMLKQQNLDSDDDTFYGSFSALPMVFSATSLEALGDAIYMCDQMGYDELGNHYKDRAKMGYRWLMILQVDEKEAATYTNPDASLGGFPKALFDPEIRIDNTQHAISALSKGLNYIYQ